MSIVIIRGWDIQQLDISNAFLQDTLHDKVYMTKPLNFTDRKNPTHVSLLKKSLYDVKQVPRERFSCLRGALLSFGFKESKTDPSLFIYNTNGYQGFLMAYVYDIVLTGNSTDFIQSVIAYMQSQFAIKTLGKLYDFFGVEATWTDDGLFLNQAKYVYDLLQKAIMANSKPLKTPTNCSLTPPQASDPPPPPLIVYRQIVGSLQYLGLTRLNVSFAVN